MTRVGAKFSDKKECKKRHCAPSVAGLKATVSVETIPHLQTSICPLCLREVDQPLGLEVTTTLHDATGRSTVYTVLVHHPAKDLADLVLMSPEQLKEVTNEALRRQEITLATP